jgi:hypothetical protein
MRITNLKQMYSHFFILPKLSQAESVKMELPHSSQSFG